MNKKEVEKLLKEAKAEVAKKYKLGDTLVCGHRVIYFDEAAELAIEKALASRALVIAATAEMYKDLKYKGD